MSIYEDLDVLLGKTDLSDTDSESGGGFENLPDGYYLCEVVKAELKTSQSSKNPMMSFQFRTVEDGNEITVLDNGEITQKALKGTKGRMLFVHYVFKDERGIKRFASDMLKFESEEGVSLLPKEAFSNSETMMDAMDVLQGMQIYVQVSTTVNKEGISSTWNNLISWKRASQLELLTF